MGMNRYLRIFEMSQKFQRRFRVNIYENSLRNESVKDPSRLESSSSGCSVNHGKKDESWLATKGLIAFHGIRRIIQGEFKKTQNWVLLLHFSVFLETLEFRFDFRPCQVPSSISQGFSTDDVQAPAVPFFRALTVTRER